MTRTAIAYMRYGESLDSPPDIDVIAIVTDELSDALRMLAEHRAQTLFARSLHAVAGSLGELTRLIEWLGQYSADLLTVRPCLDTSTAAGQDCVAVLREISRWGREPAEPRRPRGRPGLLHTTPAVAERIANLRDSGLSLHAIADRLNAEGIPTPRGGAMWRASSVQSALGYRRPHPPAPGLPRPPKHTHGPGPGEGPPKPPRPPKPRHRKPRPAP
jgi:Recombinase